ncbi:MAG: hypothetical protein K2K21_18910 [Lachnospiraceae bacterium]|nr:hypothetical protein [Lachnospiraceae bacterium]
MDRIEMVQEYVDDILQSTVNEIDKISQAIYNHSDKTNIDTLFDEILKDADVLQHCLYNPLTHVAEHEKDRFRMLKEELGLI